MVKKLSVFLFLLLILSFLTMSIYAEEDKLPEGYDEIENAIPDDLKDILPDEIFDNDIDSIISGISQITSFEYILNSIFNIIGLNFNSIKSSLATISMLLVICALIKMLKKSIANEEISKVLDIITCSIMVISIMKITQEPLNQCVQVLENIQIFVNTASPLICSMYAMGGNVKSALVNNYGILVFLSVFENICIVGIKTMIGICCSLTVASSFLSDDNLRSLSTGIKKSFTFIVGFAMLVFTTVISTQNVLSSKADTLSSKTAKMLVSQIIPLVGSTVGESLRTAGASIEYLRSNVGVLLIFILILMIAPTLITLFLHRLVFILTNSMAGLLSCEKEGKILDEISSIFGYALAILIICTISLLYILTVFAKCSSALS